MYTGNPHNEANDAAESQIRLTLQFHVETGMTSIEKEIIVNLDSFDERTQETNPLRLVNGYTAAILRMVDGTKRSQSVPALKDERLGKAAGGKLSNLTQRELDVLYQLLTGATNPEMANLLGISKNTVKFHLKNIYEKLQAKNRMELSKMFRE